MCYQASRILVQKDIPSFLRNHGSRVYISSSNTFFLAAYSTPIISKFVRFLQNAEVINKQQ